MPIKRTFLNIAIVGWGAWGGHVNVPCTSYMKYCNAADISGIVYYVACCYAADGVGWGGVGWGGVGWGGVGWGGVGWGGVGWGGWAC